MHAHIHTQYCIHYYHVIGVNNGVMQAVAEKAVLPYAVDEAVCQLGVVRKGMGDFVVAEVRLPRVVCACACACVRAHVRA